jgi:predicted nucleic acid-binding protein
MPKPRVYIETTIPSFYHDPRTSPEVVKMRRWTRLWWRGAHNCYELVTSDVVLQELAAGTHEVARSRIALAAPLLRLEAGPTVGAVVDEYLKHKVMPAVPPFDAWHLALASTHKCDFIVTWNCKHLANPNKAPHVARINALLGLYVPRLATPRDLLWRER